MRRILTLLVAVALMAAMMVGSSLPTFVTPYFTAKGSPNANACQGVIIGGLAHSKNVRGPFPPPIAAEETGYSSVKDYTKGVREGEVTGRFPVPYGDFGETVSC